jgi:O-antigen/teichoic acid export membrane protein
MRSFAAVGAARGIGLLATVLLLDASCAPVTLLGTILVGSETLALLVALAATGRLSIRAPGTSRQALIRFGLRAAPAALAAEANTRIDVAMLGLLADDRTVGVYALAVTVYEGLFQAAVVLRNQVNGPVAAALARRQPSHAEGLHRRLRLPLTAGALVLLVLVAIAFEPTIALLGLSGEFAPAAVPLLILLAGIAVIAHLLPFDQLLIVGGLPGSQSRVVFVSVATNLIVNALAIPQFVAAGAALGTAVALVVLVHGVAFRARRGLDVHLTLAGRSRTRGASEHG